MCRVQGIVSGNRSFKRRTEQPRKISHFSAVPTKCDGIPAKLPDLACRNASLLGSVDQGIGLVWRAGQHITCLIFAKQKSGIFTVQFHAHTRFFSQFKHRQRQPAIRQIATGADQGAIVAHETAVALFGVQIDMGRIAVATTKHLGQQGGLAQMPMAFAQKDHNIAAHRLIADDVGSRLQKAHGTNRRGRQDRRAIGFIIKRHVARHDRHIQRRHRRADTLDCANELAHDLGLFGIAEIQVVGGGKGQGTHGA